MEVGGPYGLPSLKLTARFPLKIGGLEDESFLFGRQFFQGRTVSSRESVSLSIELLDLSI